MEFKEEGSGMLWNMEPKALATIGWFSVRAKIGYGVLAGALRERGIRPVLTLNETEYFCADELDRLVGDMINDGGIHPRIFLEPVNVEIQEAK